MSNRAKHRTSTTAESPTQANGSAKGNGKNKVKNNGHTASSSSSSSSGEPKLSTQLQRLKAERESITLWLDPKLTIKYFVLEVIALSQTYGKRLMSHTRYIAISIICSALIALLHYIPGKHQHLLQVLRTAAFKSGYWSFLGIISSIGLGTGLHTFLLYLGPFIASVTMGGYECNSLDFPSPPYPDDIICPEVVNPMITVTMWNIISKVRWESMMWGLGTALGELPPYFMARTSRLSGLDPDNAEEVDEFENLQRKRAAGVELSLLERGKLFIEKVVERVGFFGILACASIPNPLFDLAGITCGHFLVPFSTFFGATLIGKAIIKTHIQMIFVILAFNEPLMKKVLGLMRQIPVVGHKLQEPFSAFLESQKAKYHRNTPAGAKAAEKTNILGKAFEWLVFAMILFFFVSIVNSLAQKYHKRIHKKSETRVATAKNKSNNKVSKD